jgi:dihydrofolate reductase
MTAERGALGLIWAQSSNGVIGRDGSIPWHIPEDLAHFKTITLDSIVVMGRKTWDSLPTRFRPLSGRTNIVVTRQAGWSADGAIVTDSIDSALNVDPTRDTWVIGGAELYDATIDAADRLEVTELRSAMDGDRFATAIGAEWAVSRTEPTSGWATSTTGLDYRWLSYLRAS